MAVPVTNPPVPSGLSDVEGRGMNVQAHIEQLLEKHSHLDEVITQEVQRPIPDTMLLTDLKRQKLRIKDELNKLKAEH